jgi:hypothetical protein
MRKILSSGCFAVMLAGVLVALGGSAAGARALPVRAAPGPFGGRELPARPAASSSFHVLYGVFCTSAADCWSVGQRSSGSALVNQIMHWNGKSWTQSAAPNPGGAGKFDDNELFAVRCLSSADCWAVGEYLKGRAWLGEALHWTGKKWYSTAVPVAGGTGTNDVTELFDSTCTAADNCWAVGDFGLGNAPPEKNLNLILHWNGKKWTRLHPPNPGGSRLGDVNFLDAVRCGSATDCNAVGGYGTALTSTDVQLNLVLHWNGKSWSWVRVVNPAGTGVRKASELVALACGAPESCWAAGYYGKNEPENFFNAIQHWNGTKWTRVAVPNPGGTKSSSTSFLFGATCDGPANCWAVGEYRNSHDATVNQALHWNGKRWYYVGTANPGGAQSLDSNVLYAVRCTSSANCWAVGGDLPYLGNGQANEILHWNGRHWSAWPSG